MPMPFSRRHNLGKSAHGSYFLKTVSLENLHVLSEVVSQSEDHRTKYIDLHLVFVYPYSFILRFIYNESLYLDNIEKGSPNLGI